MQFIQSVHAMVPVAVNIYFPSLYSYEDKHILLHVYFLPSGLIKVI